MRVDPVQLRAVLKRPRDCSLSDSRTPQGHRQHNRKSEPAPPNRVEYDFLILSSRAVRSVTPSLHKVASLGGSSPPRAAVAGVPQVVVLAGRYGLNLRDCPIVQLGSAHAEVDEIAASAVASSQRWSMPRWPSREQHPGPAYWLAYVSDEAHRHGDEVTALGVEALRLDLFTADTQGLLAVVDDYHRASIRPSVSSSPVRLPAGSTPRATSGTRTVWTSMPH